MGDCCSKREEARLLLLFLNNNDPEKNGCHALENLSFFCYLEKNRGDFTGYPSNHFQGCRLNGGLFFNLFPLFS
jgi:hypothetical protein